MGLHEDRYVRKLKKAADVDGLIRVMADPGQSPFARRRAALALGDLRATVAVDVLIDALSDVEVRAMAALALGSIGDLRAVGPLSGLLHSEHDVVKQSAAKALADLNKRNPGQLGSAIDAYRAENTAGARRFAERAATPVSKWADCPLCSRPLAKRKRHAVQCTHCSAYFTDDDNGPRISQKPESYGTLLGSNDALLWLMEREELFESLTDGSALAWRLVPSDSRSQPLPTLALDFDLMREAQRLKDGLRSEDQPID